MARRKRRTLSNGHRDTYAIASDPLNDPSEFSNRSLIDLVFNTPSSVRSPLREVEDRRYWHPQVTNLMDAPVRSSRRARVSFQLAKPKKRWGKPQRFNFSTLSIASSKSVAVCVRRGQRKEVLHALGKAGKGGMKRRKYNQLSKYRC